MLYTSIFDQHYSGQASVNYFVYWCICLFCSIVW